MFVRLTRISFVKKKSLDYKMLWVSGNECSVRSDRKDAGFPE